MKSYRTILALTLSLALVWLSLTPPPAPIQAAAWRDQPQANCLQLVRGLYENGDQVCFDLKNTCADEIAVDFEVRVRPSMNLGQETARHNDTVSIGAGQTETFCVPKPSGAGPFCFFGEAKNVDQTRPGDQVWFPPLNNIRGVVAAGSTDALGYYVDATEGVSSTLAVMLYPDPDTLPAGWAVTVAPSLIEPSEMPALVTAMVEVPAGQEPGQTYTITINAYQPPLTETVGYVNLALTVIPAYSYQAYLPGILRSYEVWGVEAGFASSSPTLLGEATVFANRTKGAGPLSYVWEMGDGVGGSTEENPTYTYATSGTFTVTLTASNPHDSDSFQEAVHVVEAEAPEPAVTFIGETGGELAGLTTLWIHNGGDATPIAGVWAGYSYDGTQWLTIAQDPPLSPLVVEGVWEADWDTTAIDPGSYWVRAVMTDTWGRAGETMYAVQVGRKPAAVMAVTFDPGDPHIVDFDGSGSYDPDGGALVEYDWDFGDGTTGSGMMTTHTYADPLGSYQTSLTVYDTAGHWDNVYWQVDPPEMAQPTETCGCTSMTIVTSGVSHFALTDWGFANNNLGAVNTLTAPPRYFAYAFEVEAEVEGNPALCEERQLARRTATYATNTPPPWHPTTQHKTNAAGQAFPFTGTNRTLDNYTEPRSAKVYVGQTIRWLDSPGWPPRNAMPRQQISTSGVNGVTYKANFMAIVSGPSGTCICTWEVRMRANKLFQTLEGPVLDNVNCR